MISQPCTVYDRPGSRKSMPVSYAILKFGNVLPLPEVVPPDADVVVLLLLPPPPQAATTMERPTASVAADNNHFHRFNTYLPVGILGARRDPCLGARRILSDVERRKLVGSAV